MKTLSTLLVLIALASPAAADDGRWVFSTGVDYTNGDYGEAQDTTIVTVPLSGGYVAERWSAVIIVPIVHIDGPGTIVPGGVGGIGGGGGLLGGLLGGADAASPIPGDVSETGLGDVVAALSVTPVITEDGTELSVTGRVRLPTADEARALGTGEGAAALAVGLRQKIGTRSAVFGAVGYEQGFDDGGSGVFAGIGAETYVAERLLAGATLEFAEAASELRRDATQAGAYLGFDVTDHSRIVAYGSAGLSETSPDVGAGLRLVFTSD